jgi:hypothetical protein
MAALAHELAHLFAWTHGPKHRDWTRRVAVALRLLGYPVAHKTHANVGGKKVPHAR